jgi:preprotein translocase subunit SecD
VFNFFGVPQDSRAQTPNTFRTWQYVLIVIVLIIGAIYAAPNLFQPDPAIMIRGLDDNAVTPDTVSEVQEALARAGVEILDTELVAEGAGTLSVRVTSDDDQLRGKAAIGDTLNEGEERYMVALNRASTVPSWLDDMGGKPMALGLDLSGGVHFLLQVDMDEYLDGLVRNTAQSMRDQLIDDRVRFTPRREWVDGRAITIMFRDEEDRDKASESLTDFQDFQIDDRDVDGQPALRYTLTAERITALEDRAISQNLTSLRNRVNELGVSEPQVQRLGRSRIVVDLPGLQDSSEAKRILNKFANLEFRLSAFPNSRRSQIEEYPYRGRIEEVLRRNIVTGDNVQDAQQNFDPETSQPQVVIELDNDGGRRMNEATAPNIGHPMAILFIEQKPRVRKTVVDGETVEERYIVEEKRLISVATIQGALGFSFRITGLDSLQEAQDLALLLRAGALAAPMYIVEERTVGAQLGDENVERGYLSVAIGFVIVLIFMLFYYRMFGLAANVALTTNLILIVAIMSVLGATLTVPGIAGIVLTVGMAVDANVLIFSRIKEELRERPPQQAIQAGFDRALLTITDANVTTFFVAIILLSIGSGPVRGFAITLAVGIVTSMFTAIMVTRAQINLLYGGRKLETLKI